MTERERELTEWFADHEAVPTEAKTSQVLTGGLRINKVEVDDPEYMSEVPMRMRNQSYPGFPSTTVIIGMPGSGKTNLLVYMLLSPEFWLGFFDKIYFFGPTTKSDKLYKRIEIPDEQKIADPKEMEGKLKEVLEEQQSEVETSPGDAPKILMIFEDITSYYHKIQQKPEFVRAYCQIRHVKGTSVAVAHKWHAINRTARLCSQHIILFKCNRSEIDQIYTDFPPPDMTKDGFYEMVKWALTPTKDEPKPFFYINTFAPDELKYRRNFTTYLKLPSPNAQMGEPSQPSRSMTARKRKSPAVKRTPSKGALKKTRRKGKGDNINSSTM